MNILKTFLIYLEKHCRKFSTSHHWSQNLPPNPTTTYHLEKKFSIIFKLKYTNTHRENYGRKIFRFKPW